jgi:hypothetical protein
MHVRGKKGCYKFIFPSSSTTLQAMLKSFKNLWCHVLGKYDAEKVVQILFDLSLTVMFFEMFFFPS